MCARPRCPVGLRSDGVSSLQLFLHVFRNSSFQQSNIQLNSKTPLLRELMRNFLAKRNFLSLTWLIQSADRAGIAADR